MGWREKANLLRWLLRTEIANKNNYEKVFKKFLEKTEYDAAKDEININKEVNIKCTAGWQCIETWVLLGIPENLEILR